MSNAIGITHTLDYIDFTAAAKSLPNRPHPATLWRWARKGVKIRGAAQRIHLQHVRAGGRVLTTRPWLDQFMTTLAQADLAYFEDIPLEASEPAPTKRSAADRAAAVAAARAKLG